MALARDPIPALKRQLARELLALVGHINQHVAARVLGIDQPRMSDLLHGKLGRFSVSKLVRILAHVDRRVDISVVNEGPLVLRCFDFRRSAGATPKAP